MSISVAIAGATGYTGLELIRLVLAHPNLELSGVYASPGGRSVGQRLDDAFAELRGRTELVLESGEAENILAGAPGVVFLCTPHEASAALAPELLDSGALVADLSGAFRLSAEHYPRHYGFEHPRPDVLSRAVYALPEHNREAIGGATLLACPGCYPTASLLPLKPLVDAGMLDESRPVLIDAVSGISGAGRTPSPRTIFGEVSLQAYNVLAHRHQPEIAEHSGRAVLFVPSVGPFFRGMQSLVHVDMVPGVGEAEIRGVLESAYQTSAFVRVLPAGCWPSVSSVERTNYADIALAFDARHRHAVLACAIDNLMKGASGQALQAVNIRLGFDERAGLLPGAAARAAGGVP